MIFLFEEVLCIVDEGDNVLFGVKISDCIDSLESVLLLLCDLVCDI